MRSSIIKNVESQIRDWQTIARAHDSAYSQNKRTAHANMYERADKVVRALEAYKKEFLSWGELSE